MYLIIWTCSLFAFADLIQEHYTEYLVAILARRIVGKYDFYSLCFPVDNGTILPQLCLFLLRDLECIGSGNALLDQLSENERDKCDLCISAWETEEINRINELQKGRVLRSTQAAAAKKQKKGRKPKQEEKGEEEVSDEAEEGASDASANEESDDDRGEPLTTPAGNKPRKRKGGGSITRSAVCRPKKKIVLTACNQKKGDKGDNIKKAEKREHGGKGDASGDKRKAKGGLKFESTEEAKLLASIDANLNLLNNNHHQFQVSPPPPPNADNNCAHCNDAREEVGRLRVQVHSLNVRLASIRGWCLGQPHFPEELRQLDPVHAAF